MELLLRRLQLIEEAHALSPSAPSYEGSEHWMGTGRRRGAVLVDPRLSKHVATRVKDETEVAKERRKAREERRLTKPSKPDRPKGDGKGKGGEEKCSYTSAIWEGLPPPRPQVRRIPAPGRLHARPCMTLN